MTVNKVIDQLTGKWIVRELEEYLEENFDDFPAIRKQYKEAIEQLRKDTESGALPNVDDLVEAIEKQTVSNLFFSGVLGLKSNLDHFKDPMARTVLDVDFEVYLHENTARRLPEYEKARKVIDDFFATLSPAQKELFDAVIEYIAYLETTGPKLAHYYGYIIGDDVLTKIIPGYFLDDVFTMQYQSMLECYWGFRTALPRS